MSIAERKMREYSRTMLGEQEGWVACGRPAFPQVDRALDVKRQVVIGIAIPTIIDVRNTITHGIGGVGVDVDIMNIHVKALVNRQSVKIFDMSTSWSRSGWMSNFYRLANYSRSGRRRGRSSSSWRLSK